MRTTIKDIATYTGLSVTTISLVLNNKAKKIPDSTKKIVLDAVKKLNYTPNQLAVGLVKKQTKTIGLIISDVSNAFFSNLVKEIEGECRRRGWNLMLCNTNDLHSREMEYIQILLSKSVDGILLCMASDSVYKNEVESIRLMDEFKIPYVLVDRYLGNLDCSKVFSDHQRGGFLAVKHLLDLGHKKIACVAGPLKLEDCKKRLDGYKCALKEVGIPYRKELIFEGKYDRESGIQAVEELLKEKPTAIFAFNDMSAFGVYKKLKEKQISIPGEISLVGYDNVFFSELLDTPMTTVNQPIKKISIEAVDQLIEMIEDENYVKKNVVFQPELIIRESTGIVIK